MAVPGATIETTSSSASSLVVKLKVPPTRLGELLGRPSTPSHAKPKTIIKLKAEPTADTPSTLSATPLASNGDAKKRKSTIDGAGSVGSTPVQTASVAAMTTEENGTPKSRGKPGPKRRKLDGESSSTPISAAATTATARNTAAANHKLGPKANQGAINAGLRALDRSGRPCRRWTRRGFMLKSFTGFSWAMPCWETPKLTSSSSDSAEAAAVDGTGNTPDSTANKQDPPSSPPIEFAAPAIASTA